MATAEQSIRVTAKGEFSQLQHGLKDLQGDLKGVMGEIDKGARKGGIFDDSQLRALDKFKGRFKDTMGSLNDEFEKQNNLIDKLSDSMKNADMVEQLDIQKQIKAREKELDVIRKQIIEVDKLYKKRSDEASSYEIKPSGSGSSSGTSSSDSSFISAALGKLTGVVGTVGKVALGLAGISSLLGLVQQAYQVAYQRQVGSLDLAQRIRSSSYSGTAASIYTQVANTGRRDNMGYTEAESWALQNAYTARGGVLPSDQQFGLQKFSRGYGLDATQVGDVAGTVKQLGGTAQPKQFADMIATSVSQSGMLPRIMEVMQAHTQLLQNINTTFKDDSSAQILAYQTTLDRIGTANGMTKLTGQQGANVISGLNGIYSPNNDKWEWAGISALQNYNPKKYGNMGMYGLQSSFEDGLQNADNLPAMAKYLKAEAGGNNDVFKRLIQEWLTDGGYTATKTQVSQLDQVTNGFTAFDTNKINSVLTPAGTPKVDSGAAYDANRANDPGQEILAVEAKFEKALGDFGNNLLPTITAMKSDFSTILDDINSDKGFSQLIDDINGFLKDSKLNYVFDAVVALGAIQAVKGIADIVSFFKGKGGGGGAVKDVETAVEDATKKTPKTQIAEDVAKSNIASEIGQNLKAGALSEAEISQLKGLSGGDANAEKYLTQIYRSTGDMDAVTKVASGNASASDIIDMVSNGDAGAQAKLTTSFGETGSITKTLDEATKLTNVSEDITKAGSKVAGVADKFAGVAELGSKFTKALPWVGGAVDLGVNLYQSKGNVGQSVSKAGGMMLGSAAGEMGGSALGGLIGGGIGALFGGVGAVPGAAIGTFIGGLAGGVGGGMGGEYLGGKAYDAATGAENATNTKKQAAAADQLRDFADKGLLQVGGLSTQGVSKLEDMREKGLINFTALNKDGTQYIGDLQKAGKIQITALNTAGSKELLDLQKNGSLNLSSMDTNTKTTLDSIKKGNESFVTKAVDTFTTFGDWINKMMGNSTTPGSTNKNMKNSSGVYSGKYSDWINNAAKEYSLDPNLIAGIIQTESSFDPNAYNPTSGATGLGQFLKSTADEVGLKDRTDPQSSIYALAKYLRQRINGAGGNINEGIKGYGEGTDAYLQKVLDAEAAIIANEIQYQKFYGSPSSGSGLSFYNGAFGDSSTGTYLGASSSGNFFNGWQSKVTSTFGADRGNGVYHHGLDLAASQGTELDALAGGQLSYINMDDGGKYDKDGKANSTEGGNEIGVKMPDGKTYFYSHLSDINPDLLSQYESGNKNINITSGEYLGKSGGALGVAGSGYGSTGSHLHLGYMDANNILEDPEALLSSLYGANAGTNNSQAINMHVTVDVNLKGEGVTQLNNMTIAQIKALIQQTVTAMKRQQLAMNPTVGVW